MEDKRRYGNEWLQIRGTFVEMEVVVVLVMVAVVVKTIVKKKSLVYWLVATGEGACGQDQFKRVAIATEL